MNNKQILQIVLEDIEEENYLELNNKQKSIIINELQKIAEKKDNSDEIPLEYDDWRTLYEYSVMECIYNNTNNTKIVIQNAIKKAPISISVDNNIGFDMIIPIEKVRKQKIKERKKHNKNKL